MSTDTGMFIIVLILAFVYSEISGIRSDLRRNRKDDVKK